MHFSRLNVSTTVFRRTVVVWAFFAFYSVCAFGAPKESSLVTHKLGDSPSFPQVGSGFLFADLKVGDTRGIVLRKLRDADFREIREEKEKRLVRCAAKLNGFRYDLACKFDEAGKLQLCLVEGRKGWQFSFYDDTLEPQWNNLRQILSARYGQKRSSRPLPPLEKVPFGDPGGYVTDTWDLSDRLIVLTVQAFKVKDCCTKRFVDYSCCTLLVRSK